MGTSSRMAIGVLAMDGPRLPAQSLVLRSGAIRYVSDLFNSARRHGSLIGREEGR